MKSGQGKSRMGMSRKAHYFGTWWVMKASLSKTPEEARIWIKKNVPEDIQKDVLSKVFWVKKWGIL